MRHTSKPAAEPSIRLTLKELSFAAGLIDLVAEAMYRSDDTRETDYDSLDAKEQARLRTMACAAIETLIPQVRPESA